MPIITSTFDTGYDGWTYVGTNQGSKYTFVTAGGAGGTGGIRYNETSTNYAATSDYLVAPTSFLGNLTKFKQFTFDTNFTAFDANTPVYVWLTDASGTSIKIQYYPTTINTFITHSVNLDNATGWLSSTGQPITQATLDAVVANVTELRIDLDALPGSKNNIVYLDNPTLVCFAQDTFILTNAGEKRVQDLVAGDMVWTDDGTYAPIRWISSTELTSQQLQLRENMRPITFAAGSLGNGLPTRTLRVSPQHRMLVKSKTVANTFGVDEVLIAAKRLLPWTGVSRDDSCEPVQYFHILFDKHRIIRANGALSESLFTGPEGRKSIPRAAWDELVTLFPNLADPEFARMVPTGKKARELLQRLEKNRKSLYAA